MGSAEGSFGNARPYVLILVIALVAGAVLESPSVVTKKGLLQSQMAAAEQPHALSDAATPLSVAIGFNTCLDVICRAVPTLESAAVAPAALKAGSDGDHAFIQSREQLEEVFHHYFAEGAAAERFLKDDGDFTGAGFLGELADKESCDRMSVGGNAALMSVRLSELGANVLLAGPIGPKTRQRLHKGIEVVAEAEQDEIHVILEYSTGEEWGATTSPRSNRFIITADETNSKLSALEPSLDAVLEKRPDVFVLTGLHMVESLEAEHQAARMGAANEALKRVRAQGAAVHLELSSVGELSFLATLLDATAPLVDSVGLNEQELVDVVTALQPDIGDTIDLDAIKRNDKPEPSAMAAAVRLFMERFPSVSRVHVHSLPMHMIVTSEADFAGKWGSATRGVAAGAVAATLKACNATESELVGDDLKLNIKLSFDAADPRKEGDAGKAHHQRKVDEKNPVAVWMWGDAAGRQLRFHVAPVVACKAPPQTVGLGDNISASGLFAHARRLGQ